MKYFALLFTFGLMGCAELGFSPAPKPAPVDTQVGETPPPPPSAARTIEQFDTTTQEQRAAAVAPSSGGRSLGTVVATLGDPSQPGFWVETDLVSAPTTGRITLVSGAQSVEVELRPIAGGSARVSLAAWRLLEVPLTDLAEIELFEGAAA
jgi:hypothetical protein